MKYTFGPNFSRYTCTKMQRVSNSDVSVYETYVVTLVPTQRSRARNLAILRDFAGGRISGKSVRSTSVSLVCIMAVSNARASIRFADSCSSLHSIKVFNPDFDLLELQLITEFDISAAFRKWIYPFFYSQLCVSRASVAGSVE